MGLYRAEGIVLSNRDLGEADRIVTFLCRDQGKLEAVARGARRPRNRLAALTLPFNVLRMSLFAGRGLDQLSQAESVRTLPGLRDELTRLAYASYLAELVLEFLPEREPSLSVYDLLLESFLDLESGGEAEEMARFFELRLLDLAGFRPSLDGCLGCGRPAEIEVDFSPAEGGFYCHHCVKPGPGLTRISAATVEVMARGLAGSRRFMASLPPPERRVMQAVLKAFIEARLDRELRSLKFLTGILAEPGNPRA